MTFSSQGMRELLGRGTHTHTNTHTHNFLNKNKYINLLMPELYARCDAGLGLRTEAWQHKKKIIRRIGSVVVKRCA